MRFNLRVLFATIAFIAVFYAGRESQRFVIDALRSDNDSLRARVESAMELLVIEKEQAEIRNSIAKSQGEYAEIALEAERKRWAVEQFEFERSIRDRDTQSSAK